MVEKAKMKGVLLLPGSCARSTISVLLSINFQCLLPFRHCFNYSKWIKSIDDWLFRVVWYSIVDDVVEYLKTELLDLDEDVLENFWKNKIDGSVFIELNNEYLKDLCPILGSFIKIRKLVQISTEPHSVLPNPVPPLVPSTPDSCSSDPRSLKVATTPDCHIYATQSVKVHSCVRRSVHAWYLLELFLTLIFYTQL